jgi:sugar fermentation stimulation protein A
MKFPDPLIKGRLIKRYKRFMADVELENGDTVVAHCANTGGMIGLKDPGLEVWLSPSRNPDRKLKFSWELVRIADHLVGIHTGHPNGIVEDAINGDQISELTGYESLRREVKYGKNSRIDLLLEDPAGDRPKCYVEVKNVHLRRDEHTAEFPDAVTARGAKHLEELGDMVEEGHRAVMFYLVQREDCDAFKIAGDIDPNYDEALTRARERGVEVLCYACDITTESITVGQTLPLAI